ncbi:MAG: hypothetical protein A2033_04665 [Bacteroidetes bacterium GWA2_31_9]|nr:MAG: hypothetical protein A2033_04665 [Bacteroidetes bacterium GWA2_31_9]
MQTYGKYIILLGIIILIVGIIVYLFGNKLNWLFHLPGDIRIEKENFSFFFPLTTMLLLSGLLTLIVKIIQKFL